MLCHHAVETDSCPISPPCRGVYFQWTWERIYKFYIKNNCSLMCFCLHFTHFFPPSVSPSLLFLYIWHPVWRRWIWSQKTSRILLVVLRGWSEDIKPTAPTSPSCWSIFFFFAFICLSNSESLPLPRSPSATQTLQNCSDEAAFSQI